MKKTLFLFSTLFTITSTYAQLAQNGFEGPMASPWSGSGLIVGSQGGNWNTHNGGGMYKLRYTESLEVSVNLPAVTKYIGLWINETIHVNNSISVDLYTSSGAFVQNIGVHPASSSGYWYYYEYQLGAGYTGSSKIAFSRSYSGSSGPNSTYLDDIAITTSGVGIEELTSADFKLYPNPAKNALNIVFRDYLENVKVEIVDLRGNIVYVSDEGMNLSGNETLELDISDLNAGIYVCKIHCGNNSVTQKVVVE